MRKIIRRKSHTYPGYFKDFSKAFLSSAWFQGSSIEQFNKSYAASIGVQHAISTSYGLHAMSLALEFFKFNQDQEILVPGYTAMVVKRCLDEMKIKYTCVDIDPQRGTMCPMDFKRKISKKTKGVLVTHLLGNSASEEILSIAKENNLVIIEDCAHTHGAKLKERPIGSLGDAAFFSFSYSKIINTYTGGMLLTDNSELKDYALKRLRETIPPSRKQLLRKFLLGHAEDFISIPIVAFMFSPVMKSNLALKKIKNGLNYLTRKKVINFFQYSNTQATLGIKQLDQLSETLDKREKRALYIESQTSIHYLKRIPGDVYYNHIAIVKDAHLFRSELLHHGVDTGCGVSIMEVLRPEDNLPGCKLAHDSYLMLPNYESLTKEDLDRIIKAINLVSLKLYGSSSSTLPA